MWMGALRRRHFCITSWLGYDFDCVNCLL